METIRKYKTDYKIIRIKWRRLVWAKGRLLECVGGGGYGYNRICSEKCCIGGDRGTLCIREYAPDYGYLCDRLMDEFPFLEYKCDVYFNYYKSIRSLMEARYILKIIS